MNKFTEQELAAALCGMAWGRPASPVLVAKDGVLTGEEAARAACEETLRRAAAPPEGKEPK